METDQPLRRLNVVPRRLFFSSIPSGHLEFSCSITVPETAGDLPDDAALTWQLSEDPGSGCSVGGHRAVTADDAKRGRLYLATSLPPSWPDSRLQVELQMGDLYWLLGSSVQKQALRDGERFSSTACKHRWVSIQFEVVAASSCSNDDTLT